LDFLYDDDPELDIYNEDDQEAIIEKIYEVLESYTDEEIVDELHDTSSDSERDYAAISKFPVNEIIAL